MALDSDSSEIAMPDQQERDPRQDERQELPDRVDRLPLRGP